MRALPRRQCQVFNLMAFKRHTQVSSRMVCSPVSTVASHAQQVSGCVFASQGCGNSHSQ